ncbi:MAG: hypothetical protein LBC12_05830 [Nitrososphaerota archaeon]|nr:hypothetical protein [Nitrososphaerota archaeon]
MERTLTIAMAKRRQIHIATPSIDGRLKLSSRKNNNKTTKRTFTGDSSAA